MSKLQPHHVPPPATSPDDPRLGHWLAANDRLRPGTRVAILGFPSDAGVACNGGRVGAADGPAALRAALYRMTPDARCVEAFSDLLAHTADLGDVSVTGDVERDQMRLGEAVAKVLDAGALPLVFGGGHESAYGHALGHLDAGRPVHLLNWDAHADVRPTHGGVGHSGSPFRQALEHPSGCATGYTVVGLHPWRVAASHAAFVAEHGTVVWADELDLAHVDAVVDGLPGTTYASFDLDAVDGADGVSAPGIGGMSSDVWLHAAEACGRSDRVVSADVVELNPRVDADGRAATLAALTVWRFLRGVTARR